MSELLLLSLTIGATSRNHRLIREMNAMHRLDGKLTAISGLLKSMANSHRLKILCALTREEKTVCELIAIVGLSQSAVSQHLMWLRNHDVVKTRRERQRIYYSLSSEPCKSIIGCLSDIYANSPRTNEAAH